MGMYIRRITRTNKNGSKVAYLQLAHNVHQPDKKFAVAQVLYTFGREDEIRRKDLEGLLTNLARFLDRNLDADAGSISLDEAELTRSVPMGGAHVLDTLWKDLGIGELLTGIARERNFKNPIERAVFAMVANRALAPSSKLAHEEWVSGHVLIPGLSETTSQELYRAMDFLQEHDEEVQRKVFFQVAEREKMEVDLIYFDTTSAYFETEIGSAGEDGFRMCGNSKDFRPGQAQVVIALAVTRAGIPVRCWTFPGNTADMSIVATIRSDLLDWKLSRVISVCDRGFSSEENLRELQKGCGHYIVGEKMRSGKANVEEALSKKGRYKTLNDRMELKEVVVGGDGAARIRYVLVRNPIEAERDRLTREKHLEEVAARLKEIGELNGEPHTKRVCELTAHRTYGRYIRLDKRNGQPILDQVKIKEEAHLDGKYLLRCSDDSLSAEQIALGYKGLYEAENAFRSLKTDLELRPMYHRKKDRIRSHILLCYLALVLVRVLENRADDTFRNMRQTLDRIHAVTVESQGARLVRRTQLNQDQKNLFRKLKVPEPPKILDFSGSVPVE